MKIEKAPYCILLCGLPASGKTVFRNSLEVDFEVVSSDDFIEMFADQENRTYNEVFLKRIKEANKSAWTNFEQAIQNDKNIVIDRTNLNIKTRTKWLNRLPDTYYRVGVWLHCRDKDEWTARLNARVGKQIPDHVLKDMRNRVEKFADREGFDQTETVHT